MSFTALGVRNTALGDTLFVGSESKERRKIGETRLKRRVFWTCFVLLKKYREEGNVEEENKSVSGMGGINKFRDQKGLDLREDTELD